jgi:hypothetical protein
MQFTTDEKYEIVMSLVHCSICYAVLNGIHVSMTNKLLAAHLCPGFFDHVVAYFVKIPAVVTIAVLRWLSAHW